MTLPKFTSVSEQYDFIVFGLLAQVSLIQGIPLYVPSASSEILQTLKDIGAVVNTKPLTKGAALYYKFGEGTHYLKLVGPNCPKGGGLYLTKKMTGPAFAEWLEAFVRGALLRDILERVNNPSPASKELLKNTPNDPFNVELPAG